MSKHGKKYRAMKDKAPKEAVGLGEAVSFLKDNAGAGFDEAMEISIRLGIDPTKSEQVVRGTVSLPHGTGRNVRVAVFAAGAAADAARAAGADFVGMADMIDKVKDGWTDFDIAVATTEAMKEVRKLGRVLGPRGLMPNPKTGTVTDDVAAAVQDSKRGKVEFRADKQGNLSVAFGKASFDRDSLVENAEAVLAAVRAERPAGVKGAYMRRCTVSTTMGVGIRVKAEG